MSMVGASYFDNSITWYIMEVREDGLVLKTKRGDIVEHCPYDGIVNMTFSPKTKIICIWKRSEGLTQLKKYHTKKVILFIFLKRYWANSLLISLFYKKPYINVKMFIYALVQGSVLLHQKCNATSCYKSKWQRNSRNGIRRRVSCGRYR